MLHRLAPLALIGMACACDVTPPAKPPEPVVAQASAVQVVLSKQQIEDRSGLCAESSSRVFDRDWKGVADAQFASHYNVKLDACFYLLTVNRSGVRSKKLYDAGTRELYGEYLGAAAAEPSPVKGQPKTCRVESLYCASEREWDVLVASYLQD